jgi:hypothetical protein
MAQQVQTGNGQNCAFGASCDLALRYLPVVKGPTGREGSGGGLNSLLAI